MACFGLSWLRLGLKPVQMNPNGSRNLMDHLWTSFGSVFDNFWYSSGPIWIGPGPMGQAIRPTGSGPLHLAQYIACCWATAGLCWTSNFLPVRKGEETCPHCLQSNGPESAGVYRLAVYRAARFGSGAALACVTKNMGCYTVPIVQGYSKYR